MVVGDGMVLNEQEALRDLAPFFWREADKLSLKRLRSKNRSRRQVPLKLKRKKGARSPIATQRDIGKLRKSMGVHGVRVAPVADMANAFMVPSKGLSGAISRGTHKLLKKYKKSSGGMGYAKLIAFSQGANTLHPTSAKSLARIDRRVVRKQPAVIHGKGLASMTTGSKSLKMQRAVNLGVVAHEFGHAKLRQFGRGSKSRIIRALGKGAAHALDSTPIGVPIAAASIGTSAVIHHGKQRKQALKVRNKRQAKKSSDKQTGAAFMGAGAVIGGYPVIRLGDEAYASIKGYKGLKKSGLVSKRGLRASKEGLATLYKTYVKTAGVKAALGATLAAAGAYKYRKASKMRESIMTREELIEGIIGKLAKRVFKRKKPAEDFFAQNARLKKQGFDVIDVDRMNVDTMDVIKFKPRKLKIRKA
jgi:hypothetical protein